MKSIRKPTLLLVLAVWCICGHMAHAQQPAPQTMTRIHYAVKFSLYEEQKTANEDEAILDIGSKVSHFYSRNSVAREQIKDSVLAAGGSYSDVMNALGRSVYPQTRMKYQVWKNLPSPGMLTFTDELLKKFRYTESLETPQWTLAGKDSIIADYPCQQAETFYRGRHWTVWFTPDIPVSDGPWKLHGLPGLILQAEDSEHWFSFACIEIENAPYNELAVPDKKYVDCTRKEYEDLVKLFWEAPDAFSQKVAGFKGQGFGADGRPLTNPERKALLLEK